MSQLEEIKANLQAARRFHVMQQFDEDTARRQWEEAIRRREQVEVRIKGLLNELWSIQPTA